MAVTKLNWYSARQLLNSNKDLVRTKRYESGKYILYYACLQDASPYMVLSIMQEYTDAIQNKIRMDDTPSTMPVFIINQSMSWKDWLLFVLMRSIRKILSFPFSLCWSDTKSWCTRILIIDITWSDPYTTKWWYSTVPFSIFAECVNGYKILTQ